MMPKIPLLLFNYIELFEIFNIVLLFSETGRIGEVNLFVWGISHIRITRNYKLGFYTLYTFLMFIINVMYF